MIKKSTRNKERKLRHTRLRKKLHGTPERPRLNVFRSSKNIYVQLIDDAAGKTVLSLSTLEKELKGTLSGKANIAAAKQVGSAVAKRILAHGIKEVVFDRGGYKYHGTIKALAEAAREAGLVF